MEGTAGCSMMDFSAINQGLDIFINYSLSVLQ